MRRLLPRLLSRWGVASRKEAEALVFGGRVAVDGRVVRDVLAWVEEDRAAVTVDGVRVGPAAGGPVWLALNKPRGVVTTTSDPEGRRTVMDLLPTRPPGLAPVGRLDLDTGGLLLLSSDHELAAAVLAPETHVTKTYRVKVRGHPDDTTLETLRTTTQREDDLVLGPFDVVDVVERNTRSVWLTVTLHEGKNRQIRRRLDAVGHPVEVLVRTAFGPVLLGDLAPGASRPLTAGEVAALRAAVAPGGPRRAG